MPGRTLTITTEIIINNYKKVNAVLNVDTIKVELSQPIESQGAGGFSFTPVQRGLQSVISLEVMSLSLKPSKPITSFKK